MEWRAKLELLEQIRREYELEIGTIQGEPRKFGIHRRMVREALAHPLPAHRKKPDRERPRLATALPFIDAILEGGRRAPCKQQHTARRIHKRIRAELRECEVAESTVRE